MAVFSAFELLRDGEPDPHAPEHRTDARRLAAALEVPGWERAGRSGDWFAERFVFRRDSAPPDRVEVVDPAPERAETEGGTMQGAPEPVRDGGWTRAGILRLAAAGGAVVAGGAAIGARSDDGTSLAAPSQDTDAEILNFFLLLEYLQEALYREALRRTRLTGELKEFARIVGGQESEHVAFLTKRLGGRARERPRPNFGNALRTPEQFRAAAIDLEETTIAAYLGQGANLTRGAVGTVATLLSVEARQAAWVLDLAGEFPAPHAADPARKPDDVLAHLRERRFIS